MSISIESAKKRVTESGLNIGMIGIAMIFGAIAAVPASIFESAGILGIYATGFREFDLVLIIAAVLIAPAAEEALKPLGVYLMHYEKGRTLSLRDWALLGLFAGLGFKILEDLLYILMYSGISYGTDGMAVTALLRFHFPLHLIASMITGFGVGLWHQTTRIWPFILCILMAVALHSAFNLSVVL